MNIEKLKEVRASSQHAPHPFRNCPRKRKLVEKGKEKGEKEAGRH